MVMFLLSFVKGSKSAEGGKNPLADMDRGGTYGSISASGFGPGGPNPLGHWRQFAGLYTPLPLTCETSRLHVLYSGDKK